MIWASLIVESRGGNHSPFLFIEGVVCLLSLAHTQTQRPNASARMHQLGLALLFLLPDTNDGVLWRIGPL
jgi:hypothetical protein